MHRLHPRNGSIVVLLAGVPAFAAPATVPTAASHAVMVSEAGLEAALQSNQAYQTYRQFVGKLDAEIAAARLGAAHPRIVSMRRRREMIRQKLEDLRAEIETQLAAGPSRFGGEAMGLVVAKAPRPPRRL